MVEVDRIYVAGRAARPQNVGTRLALEWAAVISGGATWARATELGPGKVRLLVWGKDTAKIRHQLEREAGMWQIAGIWYAIDRPSIFLRLRLRIAWHLRLGRRSIGGTFADQ